MRQMMKWVLGLLLFSPAAWAVEVGLVTSLSGGATLQAEGGQPTALQAFVKLRDGDQLSLRTDARLQLVYFEGGRQETWSGATKLVIGLEESAAAGGAQPEVKTLPQFLVKQLSKTPSSEEGGNVKAGMVRLRSIPSGGTLESVENHYAELKGDADPADLNPELYLLASYLELRELGKLEQLLGRLEEKSSNDNEIKVLISLYKRAMRDARAAETR